MTALYVIGALLLLLLVGVTLAPLLEDARPAVELDELPPAERREAALEALRDVEFEHETGKLDEAEYRRLRTHFGRAVLEAEAAMTGTVDGAPDADTGPGGADAPLEVAYCRACGAELRPGARYCPGCGAPRPGAEDEPGTTGANEHGAGGDGAGGDGSGEDGPPASGDEGRTP